MAKPYFVYILPRIDGVEAQFCFAGETCFRPETDSVVKVNTIQIVTLSWERARFARKLLATLYIGNNCDLYACEDGIHAVQDGDFSYDVWNGSAFEHVAVKRAFTQAKAVFETVEEPFAPPCAEALCLGGARRRTIFTMGNRGAFRQSCFMGKRAIW